MKARCAVGITVHRADGSVKQRVIKEDDLATDNFIIWMQGLFNPNEGTDVIVTMADITGASRTVSIWGDSTAHFNNVASIPAGSRQEMRIVFGDGASPVTPTRADTALVNKLASVNASSPSRSGAVLSFASSWTNDTGVTKTITEVGVEFRLKRSNVTNVADWFLMFHDAVADAEVLAGETITATYETTWFE